MCFFASLIPATFFVVVGYFVLFTSGKTEGGVRMFGRGLAIWLFVLAAFFPVCGAYITFTGLCPMSHMMTTVP